MQFKAISVLTALFVLSGFNYDVYSYGGGHSRYNSCKVYNPKTSACIRYQRRSSSYQKRRPHYNRRRSGKCSMRVNAMYGDPRKQINALSNIYFDHNKTNLTAEAMVTADKYVEILNKNPLIKICVTGWADFTGSKKINTEISTKRAETVKAYFVKKGIKDSRIAASGHGVMNPNDPAKDEKGRQKARTVKIKAR